jgi:aminocarboxymuconate-semialdehyde decarboxylase
MFSYWAKPEDALDLARYLNDDIAKTVASNPKRFVGSSYSTWFWRPLRLLTFILPQAWERWPHSFPAPIRGWRPHEPCSSPSQELKLAGVQIGSHVNEWNLYAEELFPIFQVSAHPHRVSEKVRCREPITHGLARMQEAERLNAAIFVHPWDMMGQKSMSKYWMPWYGHGQGPL